MPQKTYRGRIARTAALSHVRAPQVSLLLSTTSAMKLGDGWWLNASTLWRESAFFSSSSQPLILEQCCSFLACSVHHDRWPTRAQPGTPMPARNLGQRDRHVHVPLPRPRAPVPFATSSFAVVMRSNAISEIIMRTRSVLWRNDHHAVGAVSAAPCKWQAIHSFPRPLLITRALQPQVEMFSRAFLQRMHQQQAGLHVRLSCLS